MKFAKTPPILDLPTPKTRGDVWVGIAKAGASGALCVVYMPLMGVALVAGISYGLMRWAFYKGYDAVVQD